MNAEIEVHRCPDGVALGAFDLRNRGFDLDVEITCWPKRSTQFAAMTTGGNLHERNYHRGVITEEAMADIQHQAKGCEAKFQELAARWYAEQRARAHR